MPPAQLTIMATWSASGDTLSLGSWICVAKQIGPSPATVTFSLVPRSASA
jgi:hypothetical protein